LRGEIILTATGDDQRCRTQQVERQCIWDDDSMSEMGEMEKIGAVLGGGVSELFERAVREGTLNLIGLIRY
jgi:hypothetical protein